MIFSLAAQAAETLIVRVGFATAEYFVKGVAWVGAAGYAYVWPPPPAPPTELESLREEVSELQTSLRGLQAQLKQKG